MNRNVSCAIRLKTWHCANYNTIGRNCCRWFSLWHIHINNKIVFFQKIVFSHIISIYLLRHQEKVILFFNLHSLTLMTKFSSSSTKKEEWSFVPQFLILNFPRLLWSDNLVTHRVTEATLWGPWSTTLRPLRQQFVTLDTSNRVRNITLTWWLIDWSRD